MPDRPFTPPAGATCSTSGSAATPNVAGQLRQVAGYGRVAGRRRSESSHHRPPPGGQSSPPTLPTRPPWGVPVPIYRLGLRCRTYEHLLQLALFGSHACIQLFHHLNEGTVPVPERRVVPTLFDQQRRDTHPS